MRSKSEIVEYIRDFADRSHGVQIRKYNGDRYIVHPVRVMEMVREYRDDLPVLAAALMHDVLEDTPVTTDEIRTALLPVMDGEQIDRTISLVVELTDVFIRQEYPRLNRRTRKEKEANRLSSVSPDAQTIKYADIIDNVKDIVREDTDFAKVYVSEAKKMLHLMDAGNTALRNRAIAVVEECSQTLKKPAPLL